MAEDRDKNVNGKDHTIRALEFARKVREFEKSPSSAGDCGLSAVFLSRYTQSRLRALPKLLDYTPRISHEDLSTRM